jgi:DnaJ like chaperone protein
MVMGAVIGLIVGGIFDQAARARKGSGGQRQQGGGQYRGQSFEDIFSYYRQQTQRYDFPTQLMALSAYIMKSDGRVVRSELNYVKEFFNRQFGPQFNSTHLQSLKRFLDAPSLPIEEICADIRMRGQMEIRLQLLQYLFGIAQADGEVSQTEINTLQRIAQLLNVPPMDFRSVQGMFRQNIEGDYEILGISKSATDDEVKKAYRQMAVRFHPDKVAHESEEVQKGAKEKFQRIQQAYENIKKSRGM